MPYTWLMRIPGLAAFRREAARFALLGLVGAALLAGSAVEWLRRHAGCWSSGSPRSAILEAGWSGRPGPARCPPRCLRWTGRLRPTVPARSWSWTSRSGLRGGPPLYGSHLNNASLLHRHC